MNELSDRRMTVREAADVLGVSPEGIKKHIRELYPDLMENGLTTYLSEEQVTAIKQKMIPTTKVVGALTSLDIERMTIQVLEYHRSKLAELEAENAGLKAKAEADRPKVEFFNQVADSKDAISMREAAGVLNIPGWGRNKLFEFLRAKGILDERNIPYRKYQDSRHFRVIEQKWTDAEGETHISLKTLVYQKGLDYIRNLINQSGAREESA